MNIEELDLSYSGLVDLIQSEPVIANQCLEAICKGIVDQNSKIEKLKNDLATENTNLNYYKGGIEKIVKHMKMQPPFNFVFGDTIYAFNESGDFTTFTVSNPKPYHET